MHPRSEPMRALTKSIIPSNPTRSLKIEATFLF